MTGIVASAVQIVELKAHTQTFTRIHSIFGGEMVFAGDAVASRVECDIGDGREGVCEMEIGNGCQEIAVGLCKDEMPLAFPVDKDTVDAWRTKVARSVIFTPQACSEDAVHEHVREGIGRSRCDVAKFPVNRPYLQTLRYFFIGS